MSYRENGFVITLPIIKAIRATVGFAGMAMLFLIIGWIQDDIIGASMWAAVPAIAAMLFALVVAWIYPYEKRALQELEEARAIEAEMDGRW